MGPTPITFTLTVLPPERYPDLWIAICSTEYVRLRAQGMSFDMPGVAEEAARVADVALIAFQTLRRRWSLVDPAADQG